MCKTKIMLQLGFSSSSPFTEVGVLTGAEEPGITNHLSIISNQRVDELSTVLDSEINLASTRL